MTKGYQDYVIHLPTDWPPEQAFAVHDLLTELAGMIWQHYETAMMESLQREHGEENQQLNLFDDDEWPIPF